MQPEQRLKYLKAALAVFGVIFIVGVPVMMMWVWPSGWAWTPRRQVARLASCFRASRRDVLGMGSGSPVGFA